MATLPHIFCTECGTKNRSISRFCFTCGYQLQKKVILHSEITSTDIPRKAATQKQTPFVQQKKLKNASESNINPIESLKETTDTNTIKSESNISHQQTQIIETQTQSETIKTPNHMTQTTVTETAITASDTSVDPNTLKKDETQRIEDHKEDTKHTEIKLNQEEDKEEKQPDDIKNAESRATDTITTNNNNNTLCDCYGSAKGCRYGVKCTFSHSNPNSIPFCKFFNIKWNAGCPYGDECKFRHQTYDIKEENPSVIDTETTTDNAVSTEASNMVRASSFGRRYHTPELEEIVEEDDTPSLDPEWAKDDTPTLKVSEEFKFGVDIDKKKEKQQLINTGTLPSEAETISREEPVKKIQILQTTNPRGIENMRRNDFKDILYDEIMDRMEDLGYNKESIDQIYQAIKKVNQYLLDIVASLIVEICSMDGVVSPVICTDLSKKPSFYTSVYAFIKSIGFPYKYPKGAAEFDVSEIARIQLIDFLLTEYQTCRIIGPQEIKQTERSTAKSIGLNQSDRLISSYIGNTCNILSIECPESSIEGLKNIQQQIKTIISKLSDNGKGFIGSNIKPLLDSNQFNKKQMNVLSEINDELSKHYSLRKTVLWRRMEVTIQCMLTSDRALKQRNEIMEGLNQRLTALDMNTESNTLDVEEEDDDEEEYEEDEEDVLCFRSSMLPVWMVFAAQKDIFRNDTITCITSDVESQVRKIRIGAVPDRGGRANEVRQVVIDNIPFSAFGRGGRGRGRGRGRGSTIKWHTSSIRTKNSSGSARYIAYTPPKSSYYQAPEPDPAVYYDKPQVVSRYYGYKPQQQQRNVSRNYGQNYYRPQSPQVQTRGYYGYPQQVNANVQYGYSPQRVQSGGGQYGYYPQRNEVRTYRGYQPQARPYQTGGQPQQRRRLETNEGDGYRSWYNYPPIRT